MDLPLRDRLRLVGASYGIALLVACLLAVAAGGWLLYAAQPGTETESVVTDRWSEEGRFTHSAEVTRQNPVFETGTTLERSVYYDSVSPILEGTYVYEHGDESARTVTVDLRLVVRSTREDAVLWQQVEPLNATERTVAAGETITSEWVVNVSAAEARIQRIQEQLGASVGTAEMTVVAEVLTTAENGESTRHTRSFQIEPSDETFAVTPPESYGETYETTAERTVETSLDLTLAGAGAGSLLGGLAGTVVLAGARLRGDLDLPAAERRRLKYEQQRAAFAEWITAGEVSERLSDDPSVEVENLEGLVDIAIDTDQRVIEDRATETLWVQTPTVTYRYRPPVAAEAASTDDGSGETTPIERLLSVTTGSDGTIGDEHTDRDGREDGGDSLDGTAEATDAEPPAETDGRPAENGESRDRIPD